MEKLYKTCTGVYSGTRQLPVKNQRGRQYVNFKGKQINIKEIPEKETDVVFDYVFNGKFLENPNPILDMCARLRVFPDKRKAFDDEKEKLQINLTFEEFKNQAIELQQKHLEFT